MFSAHVPFATVPFATVPFAVVSFVSFPFAGVFNTLLARYLLCSSSEHSMHLVLQWYVFQREWRHCLFSMPLRLLFHFKRSHCMCFLLHTWHFLCHFRFSEIPISKSTLPGSSGQAPSYLALDCACSWLHRFCRSNRKGAIAQPIRTAFLVCRSWFKLLIAEIRNFSRVPRLKR